VQAGDRAIERVHQGSLAPAVATAGRAAVPVRRRSGARARETRRSRGRLVVDRFQVLAVRAGRTRARARTWRSAPPRSPRRGGGPYRDCAQLRGVGTTSATTARNRVDTLKPPGG
jgi:hypothetical protein